MVRYHKKPFHIESLRVLFHKNNNNKKLLKKFNKGLKYLKDSSKFEEYYENSKIGKYKKEK